MDLIRKIPLRTCELLVTPLVLLIGLPLFLLRWRFAVGLGRLYGRVACLFWPLARRTAMINLRRAYGKEMNYAQARQWTRSIFANLGQSLAEGIQFFRHFKDGKESWEDLYQAEDPALEDRILSDPRPQILVTGHLGSWEVAIGMAALRDPGGGAVIRRVDNPFLNWFVRQLRLRRDSQWIEKAGALTECVKRLNRGESVALLMDENGGPKGLFVDFFGRPASTQKTAALLSLLTGAPIVVGAAVRQPGPKPFLFLLSLLEPDRFEREEETVPMLTQAIVSVQEQWIRRYPLQWRWIHWRWRTRPGGEVETYTRGDLRRCFGPGAGAFTRTSPDGGELVASKVAK